MTGKPWTVPTAVALVLASLLWPNFSFSAVALSHHDVGRADPNRKAWRGPVRLGGSRLPQLSSYARIRPLAHSQRVSIALTLRLRDRAGLDALTHDLYDPASPRFHAFLTTAQFRERFAPSDAGRARVLDWLRGQGLRIDRVYGNGLEIEASGLAGRVESAFGTPISEYHMGHATFFANDQDPAVPGDLSPLISGVVGLNNRSHQVPMRRRHRSRPRVGAGPGGGFTPDELAKIYNLQPLRARGVNGSGQIIGILAYSDYSESNVLTFDQHYGLPNSALRVPVRGGIGLIRGYQSETETDVEVAQSTAPGAVILVYETQNTDIGTISNVNQAVSERRASVISTSWGDAERMWDAGTVTAFHAALQEAAVQGQSFLAPSGDDGAYDEAADGTLGDPALLAVDYPASDPYATGVGGTNVIPNPDGSYGKETAWSTLHPREGTGGGLSVVWKLPDYQKGPGVSNGHSNGMRQVPDVAALASGDIGYSVYVVDTQRADWGGAYGTSAAVPFWAAVVALINQDTGHYAGFLNPSLYSIGQRSASIAPVPFHDITQGDNLYYPATPGWDFATGWGSPDVRALSLAFAALPAVTPTPTATVRPATPPSPSTPSATLSPTITATTTALPTATPGVTATAVPTATPLPLPTAPVRGLHIDKVLVVHLVNGKGFDTKTVHMNEQVNFIVLYHVVGKGSVPNGKVTITKSGKTLYVLNLRAATLGGAPALYAPFTFRSRALKGDVYAHFTLTLGSTTVRRDRKVTVGG